MKYQAPAGVTAICCAGEAIALDESGAFDAAESLADELAAHGCVMGADSSMVTTDKTATTDNTAETLSRVGRGRSEKGELIMAQGDLISVAKLKAHLGVQSTADDLALASLISQISRAICTYLNRPFIWPRDVTDVFDGDGRDRIQLRHWPVVAVTSVSIDGQPVPQAVSGVSSGWLLEAGDDEPPGAMQKLMLRGAVFSRGWQNISIAYRAGYQIVGEARVAPGGPPFFVAAAQPYGAFVCDCGVAYANGQAMTKVTANPAGGQYAVDGAGGYLFSAQDAGANLLIDYGYAPHDLANCALEWAADRYRYRERIAMTSKSLGGQETAAFRISAMPEFVEMALRGFARIIAN